MNMQKCFFAPISEYKSVLNSGENIRESSCDVKAKRSEFVIFDFTPLIGGNERLKGLFSQY
jgi:hypothetical protein